MRNSIINRIALSAETDSSVFLITGDAGYGVLDEYQNLFPDRFLNLGVAEQNTIGFAAGLALVDFNVFVYNIIPFLLYRCYEQVRNDVCYQQLPITLVGIGSGVTYAPQGVTHYSVEDIALARTLPNLTIMSPSDPLEATACADYAIKSKKPVYIRIAKSGEPEIHASKRIDITRPVLVKEGKGVAVLFHGSISSEILVVMQDEKISARFISVPLLQPLDFDFLLNQLKGIHTIVTVEEHYVDGGLGSIISEWLTTKQLDFKLIKLGIKNEFLHKIKNNMGMRQYYGISSDNIIDVISKV